MLSAVPILCLHASAALAFGLLALQVRRAPDSLARPPLLAPALAMSALAALSAAGLGVDELVTRWAETLRALAWLGFMLLLHRRAGDPHAPLAIGAVYGVVALVVLAGLGLDCLGAAAPAPMVPEIAGVALLLRMLVAAAALVLVQALHTALGHARGGLRWMAAALGGLWTAELVFTSLRYLDMAVEPLLVLRGAALVCVAATLGMALQRRSEWRLRVSRTLAYQSITLGAITGYCALLALGTAVLGRLGGEHARTLQTAFVFGATAAILAAIADSRLRGWLNVKLSKHLFRHRYDYRSEWLRFTETLGGPGAVPLDERIVRALANLTDSPSGLLLVGEAGGLVPGATWNWAGAPLQATPDAALAAHLEQSGRVIEVDAVREQGPYCPDADATPEWMRDAEAAWVVVPLLHRGVLVGATLLGRPALARRLDWEDFDLLKAAGRQAASHLAESRAQAALAEAQRFDEFNRRFAFLLHDIKNLVSQLALTARNAERHADNPAFRADMIVTLRESSDRLNALLARLGQHHRSRREPPRPVAMLSLAARVAGRHPGRLILADAPEVFALADPAAVEQVLGHLVQNAIEASPPGMPVRVSVAAADGVVRIDVVDTGCGMSPGFVRDRLFKPFASSKPCGFGLGTFEAQQLAQGMGGRIEVTSREGEGSCFALILRAAPAVERAA